MKTIAKRNTYIIYNPKYNEVLCGKWPSERMANFDDTTAGGIRMFRSEKQAQKLLDSLKDQEQEHIKEAVVMLAQIDIKIEERLLAFSKVPASRSHTKYKK